MLLGHLRKEILSPGNMDMGGETLLRHSSAQLLPCLAEQAAQGSAWKVNLSFGIHQGEML